MYLSVIIALSATILQNISIFGTTNEIYQLDFYEKKIILPKLKNYMKSMLD